MPCVRIWTFTRFVVFALLLPLGFSVRGSAQAASPAGQDDREAMAQLAQQIRQLQQQASDLQQRLMILEARQPAGPAAPEPVHAATPAPTAEATPPPPPARDWHDLHGIQFRGFGEVNYQVLDQRPPELGTGGFVPGSAGNFYLDNFGLFLTSRLTSKASVLAEIIFEEGDAQSFRVDLRRMLLKYDYNDHLKFSFGRYQTNIGYYNWAYRSPAWLQTTTDRPLVMQYATDGGLLPTQAIGVSVTGAIPSGKLGLNYVAEYGSSDTIRPDINASDLFTDENNGNQTNLGLFARPEWVPGLQIGTSYYHDRVSNNIVDESGNQLPPPAGGLGPEARFGQTIVNAYAVYHGNGIEFLNEGFLIRQVLVGGPLHFNIPAFYSQISKQIGPWRPFFRYQYVNANPNPNSIFDDVGLRFGPSFGVRYDLNNYMAFTAQLDHTAHGGKPDVNGLQLQWAFTF